MPGLRTFVAIELCDDVLDALEQIAARLRAGPGGMAGRWVQRHAIHLTLAFLGDVPSGRLDAVYRATQRACRGRKAFAIRGGTLGCFPNARRPRVVWAGVEEATGQLAALQKVLAAELVRERFPLDERSFSPHLTLARIQRRATPGDVSALGQAVAAYGHADLPEMDVREVFVIHSDLTPRGPRYTTLHTALLDG